MYKTHLYIRNIVEDTVQSPNTSLVRVLTRLKLKILLLHCVLRTHAGKIKFRHLFLRLTAHFRHISALLKSIYINSRITFSSSHKDSLNLFFLETSK